MVFCNVWSRSHVDFKGSQKGDKKSYKRQGSIQSGFFYSTNVDTQICFTKLQLIKSDCFTVPNCFSRFLKHWSNQGEHPMFFPFGDSFCWAARMFRWQVEIYLTLDHPHVARLLMVYEDEQVGGGIQQPDGFGVFFWGEKMGKSRGLVATQGWWWQVPIIKKSSIRQEVGINI